MKKQTIEHVEARISKIRGIKKGPSPFRKTTTQIITEIQNSHGDRYLLDRVNYINSATKIEIGCKTHGYFLKYPNDIKGKGGCPRCGNSFYKSHDEFIQEAAILYPNYDFTPTAYKNAHSKIKVLCRAHGEFETKPNTLLSGSGCKLCGIEKSKQTKVDTGQCRDPNDISEHEKYKHAVWRETDRNFKKYFKGKTRSKETHLDHIVSITDGWINKIPAEIIGSSVNLRLIDGLANRKKSNKSDMSIEMLYTLYETVKKDL